MAAKKKITVKSLKRARDQILKNIRTHCGQVYKGSRKEACRAAAVIAAAEIADVFEEEFGIKI